MLRLLRAMFPYVLLVCIAAVFMALLNARGHFFVPALGATMLNVVMIASVFFLAPLMGPKNRLDQQIFFGWKNTVERRFREADARRQLVHRHRTIAFFFQKATDSCQNLVIQHLTAPFSQ